MKTKKAFTIIELLIVVVIIGVLATIMLLRYDAAQARARDTQRMKDLDNIRYALIVYRQDYGGIVNPVNKATIQSGAVSAVLQMLVPKYIDSLPVDPKSPTWDYVYYKEETSPRRPALLQAYTEDKSLRGDFTAPPDCSTGMYCLAVQ